MDNPRQGRRSEDRNNDNAAYTWVGVAAATASVLGGLYWLTRGRSSQEVVATERAVPVRPVTQPAREPVTKVRLPRRSDESTSSINQSNSAGISSFLSNLLSNMGNSSSSQVRYEGVDHVPNNPVITNLNSLLADIYVRYVALKNYEFQEHYDVFMNLFLHLHNTMKSVDPYYERYSSTVKFAGSHFDKLRIKKPDEFDMDIVIGLPLNLKYNPLNPSESDIVIEPNSPGYVQLKMGTQFINLPMRDGSDWQINRTAFSWKDDRNYLQRSKFIDWFKSLVNRALNQFDKQNNIPIYKINGKIFKIGISESGPAITLKIYNNSGFNLDVDLVPALKFPEDRWPVCRGYRSIPTGCHKETWMVVPKPNKAGGQYDMSRCWRIALHDQERELMYNYNNLKYVIKMVKKLRDAQRMNKIASYYIKTIFFHEIVAQNNRAFWNDNNPAYLFKFMVRRFREALDNGKIPYFWHRDNNLIGHIDAGTLRGYAQKLVRVEAALDNTQNYRAVAQYLLMPDEYQEYRRILQI